MYNNNIWYYLYIFFVIYIDESKFWEIRYVFFYTNNDDIRNTFIFPICSNFKKFNIRISIGTSTIKLFRKYSCRKCYNHNIVSRLQKIFKLRYSRDFCERVRRNTQRVRASGTKRIVKRRVRDRRKKKKDLGYNFSDMRKRKEMAYAERVKMV